MIIGFLCPQSFYFYLNVIKNKDTKNRNPTFLLIDSNSDSNPVKLTSCVPVSLMQPQKHQQNPGSLRSSQTTLFLFGRHHLATPGCLADHITRKLFTIHFSCFCRRPHPPPPPSVFLATGIKHRANCAGFFVVLESSRVFNGVRLLSSAEPQSNAFFCSFFLYFRFFFSVAVETFLRISLSLL